jgi:energy-coupling factor transport system substrate-specific component
VKLTARFTIFGVALLSLGMFCWPLFISAANAHQSNLAQTLFMVLMPILIGLVLVEFNSGELQSRQIAVLGVLIALNSVIRMLGAGVGGVETAFFLILISAYVFGPSFGYLMGTGSLLVSALLTGGVGPWLPFQMMAAGLIGFGAGFLPHPRAKRLQLLVLSAAAIVGAFAYGALMTMWNWPFLAGTGTSVSYVAGAPLGTNLARFIEFEVVTGGLLWDLGRAVTTVFLVLLTAPALQATLSRVARRAGYETKL